MAHHFGDRIAGLPTLQVFGRARAQAEGLRRTGDAHRRETLAALRISFLSALVLELLASLSVALVAVGIGLRLVEGHLSLSTALFVLIMAPEAYLPLRQVGSAYHDSADGVAAAERAFALIDDAPDADDHDADDHSVASRQPLPDLARVTIEFRKIAVGGPADGPERLSHFDLLIGPGETVALTGPSGCGKSTALSVLLGFSRPSAGELFVDGMPFTPADSQIRSAWLAKLAWVPQQPALLAGTSADNVRLGAPHAPTARVRAALNRAGGAGLELGQAVLAGSEGLSAGELRRVALARALLRIDCGGGELLVLDEPTAGLDAETELTAIAGVRCLGVGALVVSHRPAVLALADRVVDMTPVRA